MESKERKVILWSIRQQPVSTLVRSGSVPEESSVLNAGDTQFVNKAKA